MDDLNLVMRERLLKAQEMEQAEIVLYPNSFSVPHQIGEIIQEQGSKSSEELEQDPRDFSIAGRILAIRTFGKSIFMHILDASGKLQLYLQQHQLPDAAYGLAKKLDIGDIIGVSGTLFRTRTQELTLMVRELTLLTKNLRPLPEKYHGLKDVEIRYRQRYVDLIVNETVRETFRKRTRIIQAVRRFFSDRGFLEVETPMMQVIPGGATAKPFKTHHNALDMDLYLRIAPELYLKRLLVGGFERVFELNRNFRNEGISIQHNPEFTMLEFYQAYATYEDFMVLTEELFVEIAREINHGSQEIQYQGHVINLAPPWQRYRLAEALTEVGQVPAEAVTDADAANRYARSLGIQPE